MGAPPLRRMVAFAVDWLLFAVWAIVLFLAVMCIQSGEPRGPGNPWAAQAIAFVSVTLPFGLYLWGCEASRWNATVGKRLVGIQVVGADGGRPSRGRLLIRNGIKLLPWEMGHTLAHQLIAHPNEPPIWAAVVGCASTLLAMAFLGSLWVAGGRTPYDRTAGTDVMYRP